MNEALIRSFRELYQNRNELLLKWKKQSKKVIGYFCTYTPEEIIYAAGMLPFRITADPVSTTLADAYLPSFICPFSRSCFDVALRGGYKNVDGYVSAYTCDTIRNLLWLWKRHIPTQYLDFISFPSGTTEKALEFFLNELGRFKEGLEKFCGTEISNQSLLRAIEVYNENRTLLRKVYDFRKSDPPLVSGTEALEIVRSAMVVPKEEHSKLLKQFISEVKDRDDFPKGGVRMLVSGPFIQDIGLVETIEGSGGSIVADDLCLGSRYFWERVDINTDPLKAIAKRYLGRVKCPCRHPPEDRLKYITEMIREFKVEGVIFVLQKYCDTHFFDFPFIEEKLKEDNIPALLIEVEHLTPVGAIKTRVEAFIEMLTGMKT